MGVDPPNKDTPGFKGDSSVLLDIQERITLL
jgi:hypothetical protein